MKKIVSILLILSLCLSVCVIIATCDSSSGKSNGRLLPTTMKAPIDDEIVELPITWTENSCSVTIEGMKFTFTYDANNRTLSAAIVGENENYSVNNLCVFDENGYVVQINHNSQMPFIELSYNDKKMTVTNLGQDKEFEASEFTPDWENNMAYLASKNTADAHVYFSKYGDLTRYGERELTSYKYDEKGNILSIIPAGSSDGFSLDFSYGTAPMTASWQRIPMKFILVWALGTGFAAFGLDIMCMSLFDFYGK